MKSKQLILVSVLALFFVANIVNAQIFKVTAFGTEGFVMGDFAKKELNNNAAGYGLFNSGGGLEFNFYLKNNLGFGLRWTGNYYVRDFETFENDLIKSMGIAENQYDIAQNYAYFSFGGDLGISYLIDVSKKLQLEPYIYFGFKALTSPKTEMVYSLNNTTYIYEIKPQVFGGFSYSPGLKLNWNIFRFGGVYFSAEYDGNVLLENDVKSLSYSANTFVINETTMKYNPQSINIGIGLSFKFGKGTKE